MVDYNILREECIKNSFNVHNHLKEKTVPELCDIVATDRLPIQAILLNVTGDMNIAACIRTAHLLGFERVTVFGRRKFDNRPLVGADQYMTIEKVNGMTPEGEIDANMFRKYLVDNRLTPIFCEQNENSISLKSFISYHVPNYRSYHETLRKKYCIVMGNEGLGIPANIMEIQHDMGYVVSIPQKGVIRSYNVSAAFAILASHIVM